MTYYVGVPHLPVTFPQGASVATWRDFPRLLRIACSAQMLATWRQKWLRYLFLGLMAVLSLEGWWLAILTGMPLTAVVLPALVALVTGGFLGLHTAYRLVDRRRFVLLSKTRGVCLDARFGTDSTITPSNHGRLTRDSSAPAVRESFAAWVISLPDWQVRIKAQNQAVAAIYVSQFPGLVPETPDWLGRVPLTLQRDSDTEQLRPHRASFTPEHYTHRRDVTPH